MMHKRGLYSLDKRPTVGTQMGPGRRPNPTPTLFPVIGGRVYGLFSTFEDGWPVEDQGDRGICSWRKRH
jgi:hypothetical protein